MGDKNIGILGINKFTPPNLIEMMLRFCEWHLATTNIKKLVKLDVRAICNLVSTINVLGAAKIIFEVVKTFFAGRKTGGRSEFVPTLQLI